MREVYAEKTITSMHKKDISTSEPQVFGEYANLLHPTAPIFSVPLSLWLMKLLLMLHTQVDRPISSTLRLIEDPLLSSAASLSTPRFDSSDMLTMYTATVGAELSVAGVCRIVSTVAEPATRLRLDVVSKT